MAAVDYFLKIDGIPGDSTDAKHKDEIQLLSFSWGEQNTAAHAVGGGAATGRTTFQDFHFTAETSTASPKLFAAGAQGKRIATATLSVTTTAREVAFDFYKVQFSELLVSSFQNSAADGGRPQDQVSLSFAKIEVTYTPVSPNGAAGTPVVASWNLLANKA